ncbi:DUF2780 domain-containing protein [Vibrio nigripulchritudo]|uniref:DUF2780 domain-containing protein n=1 Tax=Vibrio nigripulchritudo TaxID=28173 RepID=UPI0005F9FB5B|nr:DUF2780 domain-containing protein [Vibrio nigripulchritudo]KJY75634.1 hypothetical protein TW74_16745 [Vibrio nigripulchritudo]
MKIKTTILALSALLLASPSHAFFGFGKSEEKPALDLGSLANDAFSSQVDTQADSDLVKMLSSQLDVSPTQATGGAGALLALASNSLSSSQNSELASSIPGLSSLTGSIPGLTGLASNFGAVTDIFTKLGLDPSMVGQFAPIILKYLGSQNASTGLLDSLGQIWK